MEFDEKTHHVGNERLAKISFSKVLNDNYFVTIEGKKDLKNDRSEFNKISLNYENDCMVTSLSLAKDFYQDKDINNSKTLDKYFEENNTNCMKEVLFQIIHCLAVIQNEYPTFRHNNFIIENIFIEKHNIKKDKKYIFNNEKYNLKDSELMIKIGIFDQARCDEINGVSTNETNRYYDLYKLFKSIKDNELFNKLDDETKNFIKENLMSDRKKEYVTPKDLLNNKYFNAYKKISSKTYMSEKLTNQFNNFKIDNLDSDNKTFFGNQSELNTENSEIRLVRKEKIRKSSKHTGKKESKKRSNIS